jgi:hypothetical protein
MVGAKGILLHLIQEGWFGPCNFVPPLSLNWKHGTTDGFWK